VYFEAVVSLRDAIVLKGGSAEVHSAGKKVGI